MNANARTTICVLCACSNAKFLFPTDNQFLHQLPADLLQDIEDESYEMPAKIDADNVNAFRKIYDDSFERIRYAALTGSQTGKKRIPPTRPYVLFLMCYDLLKREAKLLNLQDFSVCAMLIPVRYHYKHVLIPFRYFLISNVVHTHRATVTACWEHWMKRPRARPSASCIRWWNVCWNRMSFRVPMFEVVSKRLWKIWWIRIVSRPNHSAT